MASTVKLVAGIFIVMIGFPIFIIGTGVLIVPPFLTDEDGYFMSQSFHKQEEGVSAIRLDIPIEDIEVDFRIDPSDFVRIKINAFGAGYSDVFLGLTTHSEADDFLNSMDYLRVTNLNFYSGLPTESENEEVAITFSRVENGTSLALPDQNAITWLVAPETGTEFRWDPSYEDITSGALSLIIMNSITALPTEVDLTFSIGAQLPFINVIGWVLLVFGGLLTLLGLIVIWSGFRSKSRRVPRTRYYQGAMTTRVPPVERSPPNYQLQCSNCGSVSEADSTFCSQCGEILLSEDRKTVDSATKTSKLDSLEPTGTKLVVAEWGPRFWAFVIDYFIVSAITNSISGVFFLMTENWRWWSFGLSDPSQWLFGLGPSAILFFAYTLFMEHNYGQTLGKMALNLEVISESTGERPLLQDLAISGVGRAFFMPIDFIIGRIVRDETQVPDMNQRLTQKWSRVVVIQKARKKETTTQFVSNRL